MATRKTARKSDEKNQVKDVMVDDVLTIESTATMLDAAERMRDANIGMLPVMEDGVLRGVVTDRDLVVRGMGRDMRPSEVQVVDCITEPARYAEPEWTLDDAMVEMAPPARGAPARHRCGRQDHRGRDAELAGSPIEPPDDTLDAAREVSRRSSRIAS